MIRQRIRLMLFATSSMFALFALLVTHFVASSNISVVRAQQAFKVTEVFLKADNPHPTGLCPVTVNFRGYIKTDGPGTVKYIFTRSDGATSQVNYLDVKEAGTQEVATTWTLGGIGMEDYEGWVAIKVLSPNEIMSSNQAGLAGSFGMKCKATQNGSRQNNQSSNNNEWQRVDCPVKEVRTEITTPLPSPWWNTPQVGGLERLSIETIGGRRTLVCHYWAYSRTVGVMREFPAGVSDCEIRGNSFWCR